MSSEGIKGEGQRRGQGMAMGFGKSGGWTFVLRVTPPSADFVLGAEVLMHVPFWLPKMSKSDGALCD